MATTDTHRRKRFSRKRRVPITLRITPELQGKLMRRAKQEGMSFTECTSLLMEQAIVQKTIMKEAVDTELERIYAPLIFQAAKVASQTRQTNRILIRVLDNPSEDIATIVEQVEEDESN
jgi:hypothetical protein